MLRGAPAVNCCAAISTESNRVTAGARIAHGGPRLRTLARRGRELAGWIVPAGILAVLPKCPACIVAYLAIGSGIGISVSTAIYLRWGVVILCVASLSYFAASRGRRFMARRTEAAPSREPFGDQKLSIGRKSRSVGRGSRLGPQQEPKSGPTPAPFPAEHIGPYITISSFISIG